MRTLPTPKTTRLRQYFRLSNREKRIVPATMIVLACTIAGLKLFGYRRWFGLLRRWAAWTRWPPVADNEQVAIRRTSFLFSRGVRIAPWSGKCLSQSLTLWWLLMRQGIESDLRIGVRNEDGEFQAHAWIEYGGVPVNDSSDVRSRFAVFDHFIFEMPARLSKQTRSVE